ncbi:hypothetical protein GLX30_11325 [Streptomyces sp. Tu 2975]|uniref:hypothetical protein n=1 Tax=Streptomyces sp. Tu 2975 TaxID=2676871 RepID=UPI001359D372|nr:hypothetical protein [Streptomyces sp. Tu 2975]QIP84515.1 hypothetical protein GLX30_11325 [Streptomyces sp. Tu 2975]
MMTSGYYTGHPCEECGERVTIHVYTGKVFAHGSPRQCPMSGKPVYDLASVAEGRPRRLSHFDRSREESAEKRAPRVRKPRAPFIDFPGWFPRWEDEALPSVALPAKGRIGVWLPEKSHRQHGDFVDLLLGGRVAHSWDPDRACWSVSKDHFIALTAGLLRRYGRISVGREFDSGEACNPSCRNARRYECTCSCRARNHGGGSWMRGWDVQGETTRRERGRDWSWMNVAPR